MSYSHARDRYIGQENYKRELSSFFYERFYIGTEHDFLQKDSYKSFRIGKYAITCRKNGNNTLNVLNNVCLHRNNLIDPLGRGNREFTCSYHGWRYDEEGSLIHAPLCDLAAINNQQLQRYHVASTQRLHFTNLNGTTPKVKEIDALFKNLNIDFQEPAFAEGVLLHECNWKLLVENVLEGYHVSFVHKNSFVPAGGNSALNGEVGEGDYTSWAKYYPNSPQVSANLKHFPGAKHLYHHGFVFPNLFLANTNNLIGYIAYLLPLNERQTELHWQLFELDALRNLPNTVRDKVQKDAVNFVELTLAEDQKVVESCQLGAEVVGPEHQLQRQESRIKHFHKILSE